MIPWLDLHRELVNLTCRMARPLVDPHDGLAARAARQAEHLAGFRIEPGAFEVDALVGFDRQIATMRLLELRGRDPMEAAVNVHEAWHTVLLSPAAWVGRRGLRRVAVGDPGVTLGLRRPSAIGRSTDRSTVDGSY